MSIENILPNDRTSIRVNLMAKRRDFLGMLYGLTFEQTNIYKVMKDNGHILETFDRNQYISYN